MKINVLGALGAIAALGIKAEESEGDQKRLRCDIKLTFTAEHEFLNDYLEGHNTGAQPADVFWRRYEDGGKRYVRYLWIDLLKLKAPDAAVYNLVLKGNYTQEEIDSRLVTEIACVVQDCKLRKLEVDFSADGVGVTATLRGYPTEMALEALHDLMKFEAVRITIENRDQELPLAEPKPASKDDAHDDADTTSGPRLTIETEPAAQVLE